MSDILLKVENLSVRFGRSDEAGTEVLHGIDFDVRRGEKLSLVGESGSGKSVTALSIMQLHDKALTRFPSGRILFEDRDLLALEEKQMRAVRGNDIAMIFQEPMTSLNPVYTIGRQLVEPLVIHQGVNVNQARERMIELLDRTGIDEPRKRMDAFPHMLSGGQRQRVMIAMALACQPKLLIADEPTTALDVTIQQQILELLEDLQREFGMTILMITHDLNMVRRFSDRVCVMRAGELVEDAPVEQLMTAPQHEYTRKLIESEPQRLVSAMSYEQQKPVMQSSSLRCYFPIKAGFFRRKVGDIKAVDDINLKLFKGETLGIVGESGSGKTTLGMCLLRLQDCEGGIEYIGQDLQLRKGKSLRALRSDLQVVFQDPYSSLSPRMTVEQIVGEGLKIHFPQLNAEERLTRIIGILNEVGLEEKMLWRYPHEFSGGQRQRIAIARAVVLNPKVLMLDEPTSALDVSVQKQVLSLLHDLQQRHGISYLFITHDLRVIRAMSHRIMVMQKGRVVEQGETISIFENPQQAYTQRLLHASLFK
jgi:microcin C transport system ATP-binding protein